MPVELSFEERRVIGALVEKALTTPNQYPLTQNALVNACNQKSCRNPVTSFDEELVLDTLDALRSKGLCAVTQTVGGHTDRWKHLFREVIPLSGPELAVMMELLLRGPQTDGELRQNAKRMVAIESKEALREVLDNLMNRDDPLIVRLSADHRKRGVRYAHTLYSATELDRLREEEQAADAVTTAAVSSPSPSPAAAPAPAPNAGQVESLQERIEELEQTVGDLSDRVTRLERDLGG